MRVRKLLQLRITDPDTDILIFIVVGIAGAIVSLIAMPSRFAAMMAFLTAVNFFHEWRSNRRLKTKSPPQIPAPDQSNLTEHFRHD